MVGAMAKRHYILVLTTIALTLLATAGSLCPSESGACQMKCCAPDRDSNLVVGAKGCCRIEPATATSSTEAVQVRLPGDQGKHPGHVVAHASALEAAADTTMARFDIDVSTLVHRDPVPTYLLGCSILR